MADGGGRDRDRIADPWAGGRRTGPARPGRSGSTSTSATRSRPSAGAGRPASLLHGCGLDIGVAGGESSAPDRLLRPLVREGGELVETGWDQAMDRIVERSRALLEAKGGPFGFYTSGQLFGEEHGHEPDVRVLCLRFADQSTAHADALAPFVDRYGEDKPDEPERLHSDLFSGGLGLPRDLHDLYLMATECEVTWALVGQAVQGARDRDLLEWCKAATARSPPSSSGSAPA
jgi:hypothetical protein